MNRDLQNIVLLLVAVIIVGVFVTFCTVPPSRTAPETSDPLTVMGLSVFHDDEREVTCWLYFQKGISCIPDWMLTPPASQR